MPIITLTTDYGLRDPYAGQLKGALLCACPSAQLVDITHHISAYDLIEAAYFLQHTQGHFPVGTIHVCTVDNTSADATHFLCFEREGHIFLMPDNGLAYLLWPEPASRIVRLDHAPSSPHQISDGRSPDAPSVKATLASAIKKLSLGYSVQRLGPTVDDAVKAMRPHPITTPQYIRGSIVHIDRYDNAVLNVHRSLIDRMGAGRDVHTFWANNAPIVGIVQHYHEVAQGELLARYNSRGFVEIAINMGRAAQLFGLYRDQLVQLEFQDH